MRINSVLHLQRLNTAPEGHCAAISDSKGVVFHADSRFVALLREECAEWNGGPLPQSVVDRLVQGGGHYRGHSIVVRCHWLKAFMFLKAREVNPSDKLTERERVIAVHVKRGLSHKQIARALGLAPATARNHVQNIHRKLGVHSNAEMADRIVLD